MSLPETSGLAFDGDIAELPQIARTMGEPLPEGEKPVTDKNDIIDATRLVFDPDVNIDVYSLGLIYNIEINSNGDVDIEMTLTSPTCPMAEEIVENVATYVSMVEGTGVVNVRLVWSPTWAISMMSEEARYDLGLD